VRDSSSISFCTTDPFANPLSQLFENGEGVQLGLLVVTLLCRTDSRLASSLRSSLPPGRWSFGPCVTCVVEHSVFSHHVSNEAVSGRKTSFLPQHCAHLHWHVLTWFWIRHFWLCAAHLELHSMCCFCAVRACHFFHNCPLCKSPLEVVQKFEWTATFSAHSHISLGAQLLQCSGRTLAQIQSEPIALFFHKQLHHFVLLLFSSRRIKLIMCTFFVIFWLSAGQCAIVVAVVSWLDFFTL